MMEAPQLRSCPAPPPLADVEVDEAVWRAVAGSSVNIPHVNSEVCYFPQGHLEQSSTVNHYNFTKRRPWIPSQLISVRFLCNPISDMAFARFHLQPLKPLMNQRAMSDEIDGADNNDGVVYFTKILTLSDSNNDGFSVPKFCVDKILPQLNLAADPPVQNLVMTDTLNNEWEFQHIYRRGHLLTTGWSKYVKAKKLVAGDTVVFMRKKSTNKLFLGVRRAARYVGDGVEAAAEIEKAMRGIQFEVVYYPKPGVANFVVQEEKVKWSLRIRWSPGMWVRVAMEKHDSSSLKTWIKGVITTVSRPPATGLWCRSPWRMLQVKWEDPEIAENIKSVSPWEVGYYTVDGGQLEYRPLPPLIDSSPSKRLKLQQHSNADGQMKEADQLNNVSTVLSMSIGISDPDIVSSSSDSNSDISSSSDSDGGGKPPSFKLFGRTIQVGMVRGFELQ